MLLYDVLKIDSTQLSHLIQHAQTQTDKIIDGSKELDQQNRVNNIKQKIIPILQQLKEISRLKQEHDED
ncbi:MAG: hypothetical protein EB163_08835, partial [Nitrososphaeria archaeon]|nr:hypothetical protein [Nitrososphaeria archaeon]